MENSFWNDAAKVGAVMAVVQILAAAGDLFLKPALTMPATLLFIAVFVVLLLVFVKRRAVAAGAAGYSYGQCMKYIFWSMVFAGIIYGAWEIVARNLFFTERYEAQMNEALAILPRVYSAEQLDMAVAMVRSMFFSPIWLVVLSVLTCVVKGCFFGFFIAAFAQREADIFSDSGEGGHE